MPVVEQPESTADSQPEPTTKSESEWSPEAVFIPEPEPNVESVQVCEPATVSIIEGILLEFIKMDWIPSHTPATEAHKLSLVAEELLYDELDEEVSSMLQSTVVPSSFKSTKPPLVKPSTKIVAG